MMVQKRITLNKVLPNSGFNVSVVENLAGMRKKMFFKAIFNIFLVGFLFEETRDIPLKSDLVQNTSHIKLHARPQKLIATVTSVAWYQIYLTLMNFFVRKCFLLFIFNFYYCLLSIFYDAIDTIIKYEITLFSKGGRRYQKILIPVGGYFWRGDSTTNF